MDPITRIAWIISMAFARLKCCPLAHVEDGWVPIQDLFAAKMTGPAWLFICSNWTGLVWFDLASIYFGIYYNNNFPCSECDSHQTHQFLMLQTQYWNYFQHLKNRKGQTNALEPRSTETNQRRRQEFTIHVNCNIKKIDHPQLTNP